MGNLAWRPGAGPAGCGQTTVKCTPVRTEYLGIHCPATWALHWVGRAFASSLFLVFLFSLILSIWRQSNLGVKFIIFHLRVHSPWIFTVKFICLYTDHRFNTILQVLLGSVIHPITINIYIPNPKGKSAKKYLGIYSFQINKSIKTLVIFFINIIYSILDILLVATLFSVSLEYVIYYSHISLTIYVPPTLEIKFFYWDSHPIKHFPPDIYLPQFH